MIILRQASITSFHLGEGATVNSWTITEEQEKQILEIIGPVVPDLSIIIPPEKLHELPELAKDVPLIFKDI